MRYEFKYPPSDVNSIPVYLSSELYNVQQALGLPNERLLLQPLSAAPAKPRDGALVMAVSPWDPGSGDGFYGYRAGAWRFLG